MQKRPTAAAAASAGPAVDALIARRRELLKRQRAMRKAQENFYHRPKPVTSSPTGRSAPSPERRAELRHADQFSNIDYRAPHGAPDNDRKMKEGGFISSQGFIETLRAYEDAEYEDDPVTQHQPVRGVPGIKVTQYSGNARSKEPRESVELNVRLRLGVHLPEEEWRPRQLQYAWAGPATTPPPPKPSVSGPPSGCAGSSSRMPGDSGGGCAAGGDEHGSGEP